MHAEQERGLGLSPLWLWAGRRRRLVTGRLGVAADRVALAHLADLVPVKRFLP